MLDADGTAPPPLLHHRKQARDAYRAKYRGSPYLNPKISAAARVATVQDVLRVDPGRECKTGTEHMVKSLELAEVDPILPGEKQREGIE